MKTDDEEYALWASVKLRGINKLICVLKAVSLYSGASSSEELLALTKSMSDKFREM